MQIMDMLAQGGGLSSIAQELGIDEQQAHSGAQALLPAILGGFSKQAQASGSGGGIGDLLARLGGGGLMDQVLAPEPTNPAAGDAVLGHIFGSPDVSRTVAQSASGPSGLDPALLKKMLPLLAMLVSGFMAKRVGAGTAASGAGGGLGGMLGGVLGNVLGGHQGQGGGGLGGLAGILEGNGQGNALDDILRSMGRPHG